MDNVIYLGMALNLIGFIWILILAFNTHIGWGFACFFVPPIAILLYSFNNWKTTYIPFFVFVGGSVLMITGALNS